LFFNNSDRDILKRKRSNNLHVQDNQRQFEAGLGSLTEMKIPSKKSMLSSLFRNAKANLAIA
jgi:hypothetical protein